MADNTTLNAGTGGDTIATDELTTLNGGAVSLIKVQRVKVGFGSDAALRDVDAANGLPVVGTFWQATQPVSLATVPVTNAGTFAVQSAATLTAETTKVIGTVNIAAAQTLATVTTVSAVTAITNALPAGTNVIGAIAEQRAATLHITATAAVNTAATASLPAPAAGLFHYITSIQLTKRYSVIGVAAGAGIIATTTNLPGGPAWDTEQLAGAAGTVVRVIDYSPATPLKCSVAATATTFVAPLQLQTIWRWNISYFTAA